MRPDCRGGDHPSPSSIAKASDDKEGLNDKADTDEEEASHDEGWEWGRQL